MSRLTLITIIFSVLFSIGPIEDATAQRKNSEYAFERRVYKRWNRFRPWWWFKIAYRKYDNEDRRNILQLAPIMVSTTITKDYTDNQKKSIDTIFRREINLALDKVIKKRWILFDEDRVVERYERIDFLMESLMDRGMPVEELLRIEDLFFMQREKIDIVEDSYIGDAEKSDAINNYIKDLDDFIAVLQHISRYMIFEEELEIEER
ncbi:hypothetical protein [Flagellimonas flava]|uniref:hypothetical protein n=1 Tax=Flagellimonas flava TaxID=570519 RepID=UPI003D65890A